MVLEYKALFPKPGSVSLVVLIYPPWVLKGLSQYSIDLLNLYPGSIKAQNLPKV